MLRPSAAAPPSASRLSPSDSSVSRRVVAHVPGLRRRRGGHGLRRVIRHGLHILRDEVLRAVDAQLREEEVELLLERVADRLARALGEVPDLLLVGADRLLARLVEELRLRLVLLAFVRGVVVEPPLDLAL